MKKIRKIIGFLFLFIFLLLVMVLVSPFSFTFSTSKKGNYHDVMRRSLSEHEDRLITEVAMLGAHDAFSSEIGFTSKTDPAEEGIASNKVLNKVLKGMIVRQSRAQKSNTAILLSSGVRYFDVRLSNVKGTWYTKHALISDTLSNYLKPMIKFLSENPGEFVIFDIQHCYYGASDYNGLIDALKEITYNNQSILDFLNYLPTTIPLSLLTYRLVTLGGNKGGIIILAKNETTNYSYNYDTSIRSIWHNKITDEEMFAGISAEYEYLTNHKFETAGKLVVNQAQKTAQINNQIMNTIFGWSLLDLANNFNYKLASHPDFKKWLTEMPIVMVDYADSKKGDFNKKVNELIISYNQNKNI